MRIVVFGATGVVGRALLPELARTHDVVAVSRRPQEGKGVTWTEADVLDSDAVRRAVDGAEIVYYLVHSLGEGDFEERDARAAESVAEQAARAGVRQLRPRDASRPEACRSRQFEPRSWWAPGAPRSRRWSRSSIGSR
jgi:uncharacterized protein YbjT (DUF2867 family)